MEPSGDPMNSDTVLHGQPAIAATKNPDRQIVVTQGAGKDLGMVGNSPRFGRVFTGENE